MKGSEENDKIQSRPLLGENKTCDFHKGLDSKLLNYSAVMKDEASEGSKLFPNLKLPGFSCCSMKMPTAARQALAFVSNLFGAASTSTATIR